MTGPRLTEERLRNHLDSNQVMRERMCLALLPLLGPYTREQPRRPKGGADGARDIECLYQGSVPVWGAVGFRNGGGNDAEARRAAEEKFEDDLNAALKENPTLSGFVFFTNVDLTIERREKLVQIAQSRNVKIIDIFDMERLRHALDSPEGLIARLQYLDIPMTPTEQLALVGKFGNQLQNAVTARFDRVERTLAQMERFLDFQKPLLRFDVYAELQSPMTSAMIGEEAIFIQIRGLHDISKTMALLLVNHPEAKHAAVGNVVQIVMWNEETPGKLLTLSASASFVPGLIAAYSELSLATGGHRVRVADLTILHMSLHCTLGFRDLIKRVAVDLNGYEVFNTVPDVSGSMFEYQWPEMLPYKATERQWTRLVNDRPRNFLFEPPRPSGRLLPVQTL